MMKTIKILFTVLFLIAGTTAYGAVICQDIFLSQTTAPLATIRALAALRLNLDLAQSKGTNSIELTALASNFKNKKEALVQYLEKSHIMTRAELIEEMKREISILQSKKQAETKQADQIKEEARRRQEQVLEIQEGVIDGNYLVMHRIEPGKFQMMDEFRRPLDVTLKKPFDMMATPTTQVIWRTIADLVNAKFGEDYNIDPDPSRFKEGTRPVESVSYNDIQIWIEGLNELSKRGEPALADLIPRHKKGDVYRLPTEAEWEFVVRGRGQMNDVYHFGSEEARLRDYGWYKRNSDDQTHPVAQKRPLVIDGKNFYDMYGNVWELVQDFAEKRGHHAVGVGPKEHKTGFRRVTRGGAFGEEAFSLESRLSSSSNRPDERDSGTGFRLVRTVK